jgi:hypothetical protein
LAVTAGEYASHSAVSRTNTPVVVGREQGLRGHMLV